MLRVFVSACLLGSLTGCAGAVSHPPPKPVVAAVPAVHAELGTILAARPVPIRAPQPVRVLLHELGGGSAASGSEEFIVRSDDGDTLAVVQPGAPTLLPGRRVVISRGRPTLLTALPASIVVR